MATTTQTFTGTGSQTQFSIAFSYRTTADVKATINAVATTAFSVSGSTVTFTSAPANGAAVVIFRETTNDTIEADFQSGSALRAVDLNDNFEQLLFVTQESTNTAATAETNSNTAVSTANTASTNASNAVTTANSAATDAATAISTANSATTTANSATATANAATTTANTASTNATAAVNTANTASSNATAAVNTANTASSNATAAVNTANTASSNATTAVNTANAATTTANAASAAVANAVLYDPVANVAAIPGSPSDGDYVEVQDSTGIQSFSPLSGMPAGFVGDSGLVVRLKYVTSPSTTWQWQNYFAKDSETRYLKDNAAQIVDADINASAAIGLSKLATGALPSGITVASANITNGTIVDADISGSAAIGLSKLATGALPTAITVTSANISDLSIVNADVNASAAIAGTKISPDFGSQNVLTTGSIGVGTTSPGYNLVVSGTGGVSSRTIATDAGGDSSFFVQNNNGSIAGPLTYGTTKTAYGALGSGETAFYSNRSTTILADGGSSVIKFAAGGNTERMRIDSSGRVGIGLTNPSQKLHIQDSSGPLLTFDDATTQFGHVGSYNKLVGSGDIDTFLVSSANSKPLVLRAPTGQTISFDIASNNAMRIDSSGSVGIGTNSPTDHGSYGGTLEISGSPGGALYLKSGSDVGQLGMNSSGLQLRTRSAKDILFTTNNSERARIDSSGNIGIGTSSPGVPLDIAANNSTANLRITDNTNGARIKLVAASTQFDLYNTGGAGYIGTPTNSDILIATNNTERMRISSSGRLGVGTSSPDDTLHLNGSTGYGLKITDSSSHIAVYRTHSDGAVLKTASNHALLFGTNDQERLRIDSSGNLMIGRTSLANQNSKLTVQTSGACPLELYSTATSGGYMSFTGGGASSANRAFLGSAAQLIASQSETDFAVRAEGQLLFATNGANERMRLSSAGEMFINTTSKIANGLVSISFGTSHNGISIKPTSSTLNQNYLYFINSAGSVAGYIRQTGTTTTFYGTSSDHRLKENVVDIADGITRVKQLQPRRFNFIDDADTTVDGFLAHEAQTVVPEAVSGTHNEVDDDGNAVMQGIDQSKLVPLLTAALQEAIAKIETLEAKVAALEAA